MTARAPREFDSTAPACDNCSVKIAMGRLSIVPSITEEMLRDMASVIARQVSPEAIILFGSRATGRVDADSDIDLIVVESRPYGPGNDRRQKATLLWKALAKYPISKDILVYSKDEVDRWRDSPNHVIAKALKEGRFLYGAL